MNAGRDKATGQRMTQAGLNEGQGGPANVGQYGHDGRKRFLCHSTPSQDMGFFVLRHNSELRPVVICRALLHSDARGAQR